MLVNIVNEQVKLGIDVSILILNDNCNQSLIESIDPLVNIIRVNRPLGSHNPLYILRMRSAIKRLAPDIIHVHFSNLLPYICNRKNAKKICYTLHALPFGEVRASKLLYRLFPFLNKNDSNVHMADLVKVLSISHTVHDQLLNQYSIDSAVVENGIDLNGFVQRESNRLPSSPFKIVQIGRLDHKNKGQDILVKAVAKLKGKVVADFIGSGESEKFLKKLAKELNVEEYVNFLGSKKQKEIRKIICNYDLCVQPSRFEGFGLTVAEALAAKVPVLVTEGLGSAELTEGEKYGYTFKLDSVDDFSEKINFIKANYKESLLKAEKAFSHVELYDVIRTSKHYYGEYLKMMV